jgi:transposase
MMPTPLSNDLRKRIIESAEKGHTIAKIAQEKNVSQSVVYKLLARYRQTGSYAPRPLNNGRKPALSSEQLEAIKKKYQEQPDATLQEVKDELGLPVCISALCRIVNNKLGLRRKKNGARRRAGSPRRAPSTRRLEGLPTAS